MRHEQESRSQPPQDRCSPRPRSPFYRARKSYNAQSATIKSLVNLGALLLIVGGIWGMVEVGRYVWRNSPPWIASQPEVRDYDDPYYFPPNSDGGGGAYTSDEAISYFLEIALGSEFGNSEQVIRKWEGRVRIAVYGNPTQEDEKTLQLILEELEVLAPALDIGFAEYGSVPNIEFYFVPEPEFRSYEPNYRPRNMGFFWVWWDDHVINRARILIASEDIDQQARSHLIREELTQALGLMQDSDRYPDSVFFSKWTKTTEYSEIDRNVIALLYRPDIRSGMTRQQVLQALQTRE
jgi:hypothetical protein